MPQIMVAKYTEKPVVIDGNLDDAVWKNAVRYSMCLSRDSGTDVPKEGGEAMLAWDEEALYVGAHLVDSDVVQKGEKDQSHFYKTGDLLEVFLKPEKEEWYWELYGTPKQ